MKLMIALASMIAWTAAPVLADLGADCLAASQRGDNALSERYVDMMLFSAGNLSEQQTDTATACLLRVTGQRYVYAADIQQFELANEHNQALAERQRKVADKISSDREKARRDKEIAERAKADEARGRAAIDKINAEMERDKTERQLALVTRLSEACANLYRRDPDTTITNKLCFDLFMEDGLPAD